MGRIGPCIIRGMGYWEFEMGMKGEVWKENWIMEREMELWNGGKK